MESNVTVAPSICDTAESYENHEKSAGNVDLLKPTDKASDSTKDIPPDITEKHDANSLLSHGEKDVGQSCDKDLKQGEDKAEDIENKLEHEGQNKKCGSLQNQEIQDTDTDTNNTDAKHVEIVETTFITASESNETETLPKQENKHSDLIVKGTDDNSLKDNNIETEKGEDFTVVIQVDVPEPPSGEEAIEENLDTREQTIHEKNMPAGVEENLNVVGEYHDNSVQEYELRDGSSAMNSEAVVEVPKVEPCKVEIISKDSEFDNTRAGVCQDYANVEHVQVKEGMTRSDATKAEAVTEDNLPSKMEESTKRDFENPAETSQVPAVQGQSEVHKDSIPEESVKPTEAETREKSRSVWYTDEADGEQTDTGAEATGYTTAIVGGVVVRTPISSSPSAARKSPKHHKGPSPSKFKMAWGSLFRRKKPLKKSSEKVEGSHEGTTEKDTAPENAKPEKSDEEAVKAKPENLPRGSEEERLMKTVDVITKEQDKPLENRMEVDEQKEVKECQLEEKLVSKGEISEKDELEIGAGVEGKVDTEVKVETEVIAEGEVKSETDVKGEIEEKYDVEISEAVKEEPPSALVVNDTTANIITVPPSDNEPPSVDTTANTSQSEHKMDDTPNIEPAPDSAVVTAGIDTKVDGKLLAVSEEQAAVGQRGEKDITSDPESQPDEDSILRERIASRESDARSVSPHKTKQMHMRISYAEGTKDGGKVVEVIGTPEVTMRPKIGNHGNIAHHRMSCRELGDVDFEGWLTKKGGSSLFASWKRKWVVLKERRLYYYKTSFDLEAGGVINLEECKVSAAPDVRRKFCFKCETKDSKAHTTLFAADTEENMNKWLAILERACKGEVIINPTHQRKQDPPVQMRKKSNSMSFARRPGSILGIGGNYDYDGKLEKQSGPRRRASSGSATHESKHTKSPPIEKCKDNQETSEKTREDQTSNSVEHPIQVTDADVTLQDVISDLRGGSETTAESTDLVKSQAVSLEDDTHKHEKPEESADITVVKETSAIEIAPVNEVAAALEEIQTREEGSTPQIVPLSEAITLPEDSRGIDKADQIATKIEVVVSSAPNAEEVLDTPQIVPLSEAVIPPVAETVEDVKSEDQESAETVAGSKGGEYVTLEIGTSVMQGDVVIVRENEKNEEPVTSANESINKEELQWQVDVSSDIGKPPEDKGVTVVEETAAMMTVITKVEPVRESEDQEVKKQVGGSISNSGQEGSGECVPLLIKAEESPGQLGTKTESDKQLEEEIRPTEKVMKESAPSVKDEIDGEKEIPNDKDPLSTSPGKTKWYVALDSEQDNWVSPEAQENAATNQKQHEERKRLSSKEDEMLSMVRNIKDAHLTFTGVPLPGNEERTRAMSNVSKENADAVKLVTLKRTLRDKERDIEAIDELLNQDDLNRNSVSEWVSRYSHLSDELTQTTDGECEVFNDGDSDRAEKNGETETSVEEEKAAESLEEERPEHELRKAVKVVEENTNNMIETESGDGTEEDTSIDTHF